MFENLWVESHRPKTLKDIVLSDDNRKYFEAIKDEIPNLLLHSAPGSGKTSLAKILVKDVLKCQYLYINASDESGIDTIRTKVITFAQTKSFDGKLKVIILDEIDGLSSVVSGKGGTSAQQALRNVMEEYASNCRFILTCNYLNKVIPALQSRCQLFNLVPPLDGYLRKCLEILKAENISIPSGYQQALTDLLKHAYPDLRSAINSLHKYSLNGVLKIDEAGLDLDFAKEVLTRLRNGVDSTSLRKYVIEGECKFSNNYQLFLKGLFEAVHGCDLTFEKKRAALLEISEALYRHAFVMDHEINAFACLLRISNILEG